MDGPSKVSRLTPIKIAAALVAGVLLVGVAACGSGSSDSTQSASYVPKKEASVQGDVVVVNNGCTAGACPSGLGTGGILLSTTDLERNAATLAAGESERILGEDPVGLIGLGARPAWMEYAVNNDPKLPAPSITLQSKSDPRQDVTLSEGDRKLIYGDRFVWQSDADGTMKLAISQQH